MQWNDVIVCHGLAISDSNYLLLTSQQEHIKSWIQEVPSFGSFYSHSNDIWGKNLRAPVHTQSNICQTRIHAKITTTIHINIYTKYDWSHRLERLRTRDRASRRMRKKRTLQICYTDKVNFVTLCIVECSTVMHLYCVSAIMCLWVPKFQF